MRRPPQVKRGVKGKMAGRFGVYSVAFGGVDEFAFATGAQVGPDVASSIAIWCRVPASASIQGLWGEYAAAGSGARYLQIRDTGAIQYVVVSNDAGTAVSTTTATVGLDNGLWHLFVVTERSDRLHNIYIDGALATGPTNYAGNAVTVDGFTIARRPSGVGVFDRYLIGDVAHLAIWTRELTAADVTRLWNQGTDWDWRTLASGRPRDDFWLGENDTFPTLTNRGSAPTANITLTNLEAADIQRVSP